MSARDPFEQMKAALDAPGGEPEAEAVERALRWRLVLGRHADDALGFDAVAEGDPHGDLADQLTEAQQVDVPLAYIYEREHRQRQHRQGATAGDGLSVPMWLARVRTLFPREAVEVMERDALHRYGLTELVTDPEVLRKQTPTPGLLKAILQFKHRMTGPVLVEARAIVAAVVAELRATLETATRPALYGPSRPDGRPPVRAARNVDWHRTIARNLRNYDLERRQLVVDRVDYRHRTQARSAWRIILAVDQSGSMLDSLIHASVMAAIFAGLPAVDVRLVLWDHRLVDVSHLAPDPLEVLMGVQLGGGTVLRPALRYCADLITVPERTILCVLSDWYLGDDPAPCLALARELTEAGVTGIGLSALDADGHAAADTRFAQKLADCGWFVAALTPRKLAEHVGRILR